MAIVKANELDFSNKKIAMIIAGFPGIGKTTLALSAPNPLLIDIDDGIDRVSAPYRKDTLRLGSYDELIHDLTTEDLSAYETLVIDTGGKLFDLLKPVVIKESAQNGQRDGSLTLKGYGAVARKFSDFVKMVRGLNKHLIVLFHTVEEKDGDLTKLRIMIEGQTKDRIWQDMDLGGFMEMQGKNRTIGFSNTERYFAKGTHGIKGIYTIPTLDDEGNTPNTFLTDLFAKVTESLQASTKEAQALKEQYNEAMQLKQEIDIVDNVTDLNNLLQAILSMTHALTSEKELKVHLHNKALALGFKFDKTLGGYVNVENNNQPSE